MWNVLTCLIYALSIFNYETLVIKIFFMYMSGGCRFLRTI